MITEKKSYLNTDKTNMKRNSKLFLTQTGPFLAQENTEKKIDRHLSNAVKKYL